MTKHEFQEMQAGCRHILQAVSVAWGHPEGWRFEVEFDAEGLKFHLSARKRVNDRLITADHEWVWFEGADVSDGSLDRKAHDIVSMYQQALMQISRGES